MRSLLLFVLHCIKPAVSFCGEVFIYISEQRVGEQHSLAQELHGFQRWLLGGRGVPRRRSATLEANTVSVSGIVALPELAKVKAEVVDVGSEAQSGAT